ncbi:hypothetical protein [Thalassobacillus sp. CUG 92003]|uniref:hypothetical protein n=1 Tax=Thalassobacillus sp. CUG 92003 TaxID=2736641 RepID=UPI0015E6DBF1|nr:hypothetical protein [Thalassobacillus sp. CUG 92003]
MESPEIQLFNAVFAVSTNLSYTTIDYSPVDDESLAYPFVHVGETNSVDVINNKDVITGRLRQTVHVWGQAHDRALFSDMLFQLKTGLRRLRRLENYRLELIDLNSNQMFDNTTHETSIHGTIEVEYKLS